MLSRERWLSRVDQLREDNISGASEITAQAIELLVDTLGDVETESVSSFGRWLLQSGRDLVAAQPSMGGLFRLVNDMLWVADEGDSVESRRRAAIDFLQRYQQERVDALASVAREAWPLLHDRRAIMTYSRSATLVEVLRYASERGSTPRVYCSESRPVFEGQTLANELSSLGIEVMLGIDMALFGWLDQVEALILGADSLSTKGLINKIGTAALANAARARKVPVIVVCTTEKFLPSEYVVGQDLSSGPETEIMPTGDQHIEVRNVYFDVTPLQHIDQVVTERGSMRQRALLDALEGVKLYPGLYGS